MTNLIFKGLINNKNKSETWKGYKGNYILGSMKGNVRLLGDGIEITISNMKLAKELKEVLDKY